MMRDTDAPVPRSAHPGIELERLGLVRASVTATEEDFPDISSFQTSVDLDALANAYHAGQIGGVSLRAGWGVGGRDSVYVLRRDGLRARGVRLIHYWFNYPAYNSAGAEAADFNSVVGPLGPGEAMMADAENDPNARAWPTGGAAFDWLRAFLSAVQAPQNATWWYCSTSFVGPHGLSGLAGTWGWVEAAYVSTPNTLGLNPICWQSTDCAAVPGVGGCCDFNRVLRAPLAQWLTPGGSDVAQLDDIQAAVNALQDGLLKQTYNGKDPNGGDISTPWQVSYNLSTTYQIAAHVATLVGDDDATQKAISALGAQAQTLLQGQQAAAQEAIALQAAVTQLEQQVQSGQPTDLTAVKASLAALSAHLGVGTA